MYNFVFRFPNLFFNKLKAHTSKIKRIKLQPNNVFFYFNDNISFPSLNNFIPIIFEIFI